MQVGVSENQRAKSAGLMPAESATARSRALNSRSLSKVKVIQS
jgi:hypothetical protein